VEQRTGIIKRFAACFRDHRAVEQVEHRVRRVWVSMAGGYPYAELFAQVYAQLQAVPLRG
jgi:hypothetical protein